MPKDRHSGSAREFVNGICKKPWNLDKAKLAWSWPCIRLDAPVPISRKRPGSGITEATSSRRQRPTRRLQGQLPGQEKRVLKATEGIANPSWGWEGAVSPLRASLTSLEPRGLRAASRGTRWPQGGGWGRAPARRTAPSPDSAPPLPESKRWRTRKLPRTGTDFRANRAAALAFSGGSDAIGSCSRRAEMSKLEGCAWLLLRKLEDGVPCQITRPRSAPVSETIRKKCFQQMVPLSPAWRERLPLSTLRLSQNILEKTSRQNFSSLALLMRQICCLLMLPMGF
nr:uncharacterized protein LOC743715 [Pan troglodytes]